MLVELCVGNYATHDGLVNGVDAIFQGSTKVFNSQEVIWILFNNPKCDRLTRIKNAHSYEHEIHPTCTPIEPISKDIKVCSSSSHIITRTQFPIQLVVAHTRHWAQGLTLDYLAFDLTNVYKHGLPYTTLSCVKKKKIFTFYNFCKWFFFKLIQVLPWRCTDYKPLHDETYLSPNHIHFVIHMY